MPLCDASVFVAGHRGMVGAAIVRRLRAEEFNHIITRAHAELDLADQAAVNAFFAEHRPRLIYLAAAKVGASWPMIGIRLTSSTRT